MGWASALQTTRISAFLAVVLVRLSTLLGPMPFLAATFLFAALLSCIVSNAATVVLLYSVLRDVQVDGLRASQCMCAMMLGASSAFMTPIGYQTNLMVLAPGGYRFGDFALLGGCLTLLVSVFVAVGTWLLPEWYMP